MADTRAISSHLQKRLSSLKRDGVSVIEATDWLVQAGLLEADHQPSTRLREMLRDGRVKGAYQFPNKRWVIVNNARMPDGVQGVVPIKEASKSLKISAQLLKNFVEEGKIDPLKFGDAPAVFTEDAIRQFRKKHRQQELLLPGEVRTKTPRLDRLKRELYYLRSDIRVLADRIEELIKTLD